MRDIVDFNTWRKDLARACGHFKGVTQKHQSAVRGRVTSHDFNGLAVADICGDIAALTRDDADIQRDKTEHVFCIIQASGTLQADHNSQRSVLGPGDCILLDSTRQSTLSLIQPTRLLVLQMPRDDFLRSSDARVQIGKILSADHPLAPPIRQQIQHFSPGWDSGAPVGRANADLIQGMIRLAFSNLVDFAKDHSAKNKECQFAVALDLIQQNLTNPDLSLAWLSQQIGMSTRQLQRLFEAENTSFSSEVRDRRLTVAAARLRNRKTTRRIHISEVAFDSGFRDLSNFNRGFKSRFGMAPREYLETVA